MALIIGFFISLLIGLTGVGAGILTTPLLLLFYPIEPAVAVGTALTFATVIKAYSGTLYFLKGFYDRKILFLLMTGGIPGVILGSYLISFFPIRRELVMFIIGAIVFLSSSLNLFFAYRKIRPLRHISPAPLLSLASFFIGVEVGFSSVGAGVLVELLLLTFTNLSVPAVIGTSLIYGSVVSLVGGSVHFLFGNVNPVLLFSLLLGGVAGAFLASRVVGLLPQQALRYALLSFLMLIGISLIYRGVSR